ncbi:uncharacterized protein LOC142550068 [Primulina tabacum]|uniref:uncharacterized protein LOC142550068 n=1 Tax=Primulina tabacum TaxID=48773 RepID=UPI003F5A0D4F
MDVVDLVSMLLMILLLSNFHSRHPPRFSGSEGAEKAELWISEIEELFDLIEYPSERRLRLFVHQLKDRAKMWWSTTLMTLNAQRIVPSWDIFKLKFKESYCPPSFYSYKALEFHNLKQGDMSVADYADTFYAMLRHAPHAAASQVAVVESLIEGLNDHLHPFVSTGSLGNRGGYCYSGPYCDHCGGKHTSNQYVGVQGVCNVCGRPGHFARVCPSKTGKSAQAVSRDLRTTSMNSNLSVATPMGKMIITDNVVFNAFLFHDENVLYLNLIVLPIHDFDRIIGMDVLTANRATVDSYQGIYHPGKVNVIVDALSRKVIDVNLSSIRVSKLREDICTSRLVVPDIPELRTAILKEAHCTRYSIHSGGRKMYHILRPQFWWKNMKKDVAKFVSRCMIYQQVKAERMRPVGLLHSLEVPQWN